MQGCPNLPPLTTRSRRGERRRSTGCRTPGRSRRGNKGNSQFACHPDAPLPSFGLPSFALNSCRANALRRGRQGRRSQLGDHPQYVREHSTWNGYLRHQEGDVATIADDLRANLDQLLFERLEHAASSHRKRLAIFARARYWRDLMLRVVERDCEGSTEIIGYQSALANKTIFNLKAPTEKIGIPSNHRRCQQNSEKQIEHNHKKAICQTSEIAQLFLISTDQRLGLTSSICSPVV